MKTKLQITRQILLSNENVIDEKLLGIIFYISIHIKNIKIQFYAILKLTNMNSIWVATDTF